MTHVQARQALGEQSGYYGLFVDFPGGDYSNKAGLHTNATYYLNAGVRWLDRMWTNHGVKRRYTTTIPTGAWNFDVPQLDYVTRVDIWDGDDRYALEQKTEPELRDLYTQELYANVTTGRPLYYARASKTQVELLANASFDSSPEIIAFLDDGLAYLARLEASPKMWIAQGGKRSDNSQAIPWAWSAGELSISNYAAGNNPIVAQYVGSVAAGDVTVTIDLSSTGGTVLVTIYSTDGSTNQNVTLSSASTLTHTFEDLGAWNIIQVANTGGDNTVLQGVSLTTPVENPTGMSTLKVPWFITMPPADKQYDVTVFGDFSVSELVDDTDTNFWLDEHPEFVIRAARMQMEIDGHRNVSGFDAFRAVLEDELERLLAQDQLANISGIAPEDFVRCG